MRGWIVAQVVRFRVSLRRLAACAFLVGATAQGCAQVDERLPAAAEPAVTGTVPAPSAPTAGGTRVWSGSSGASGHPLMTAQAIEAAASQFDSCVADKWPLAARRGVSRESFERYTRGLTPDLVLMDLMDAQPEFTKSFWDYLDTLVAEARIQKGQEMLALHKATFDAMEQTYGVDRYVVAAIWGVETKFSTVMGERPLVRSTATLACIGRRQPFFTEEFLAVLEILHRGDIAPEQMKGSWAGAFGPTQFMPTVFKRFAVDFDGDGRRNLMGSVPDHVASTANYLKRNGWATGQTWGYEVAVPQGFNFMLADRNNQLTMRQWAALGIARPNGQPFARPDDRAYLLVPAGSRGPGFLMLNNFRTIMRYNPAEAYALAIGHLADRMRGGGPIVQPWPRDERVLTREERSELQQRLAGRGFDIGEPDGRLGAKTRTAIRDFQARAGMVPDGFASGTLLARLRGQ